MYRKILLATDGSDCALKAASAAVELAQRFEASLLVIHVFVVPTSAMPFGAEMAVGVDPVIISQWADDTREAVQRRTETVLRDSGVPYSFVHETGHPADTIVRIAEEQEADLIVIGSRGLSGIREFLLGSVSDRVMHLAHCPVLVIK